MIDVTSDIDEPFELTQEQVQYYQENGFIKLKNVIPENDLERFNLVVSEAVNRWNTMHIPLEERSTYDRAFIQITNLWTKEEDVKEIVLNTRLAGIARTLMGTRGVRLYHDQALFKEPGGGHTPWHADQYYWPLSNSNTCTVWIPLQETPEALGPLEFSASSHQLSEGRDLKIGDDSEKAISSLLAARKDRHVVEPFDVGEVSFHNGWLFHRAGPNRSAKTRKVFCIIYMDSEMRLKEPENDNQKLDKEAWCPGVAVGEVINSELNPVLAGVG